jgi:predicted Fe-Mo cluster-binding NifX family protein
MRVAIPVWNDRVSPVFDTATCLMLLDCAEGALQSRRLVEVGQASFPTQRAKRLAELGVHVLICGAISRLLAGFVSAEGIVLVPWVAGPVEDVLRAYLAGRLSEPCWRMPGCGGPQRRRETHGCSRGPRSS